MKFLVLAIGVFFVVSPSFGFEVADLETPESFIVDPESGEYYISNINGSPANRDNNGFITKLHRDGSLAARKFITGGAYGVELNAPKGLAIVGNILYVTDIDRVRGFDKGTGKLVHIVNLVLARAKFLNDLVADVHGNLYVSDTAIFVDANAPPAIFKIETANKHKVTVYSRDSMLAYPNGLMIHPKTNMLLVNTWGEGRILEVSESGKIQLFVSHESWKDLDGFDYDSAGNLYISSFTGGSIFRIEQDRSVKEIVSGLTTPADISVDRVRNELLIPLFNGHAVTTLSITP
tara:strand:+ start:14089 stop:14961 length:873 start_codon:yes stop_codon:yes gene_type:complete